MVSKRSPIGWPGSKARFVDPIVSIFPSHHYYVEPFCGSLEVLLSKKPAKFELANDLHRELINFFWVVKTKPKELVKGLDWLLPHEYLYNKMKHTNPAKLGDVQRAVRFLYMNRQAFGMRVFSGNESRADGRRSGENWALSIGTPPKYNFYDLKKRIRWAHKRLSNVTFVCRDFRTLATHETINRPGVLWYIDPPYWEGTEYERGYAGGPIHPEELREFCDSLRGNVVASHQSNKEFERAFKGWEVLTVGKRINFLSRVEEGRRKNQELVFCNFMPNISNRQRRFV